ncbi:MAG TPA: hypothetical protein VID73_09725 [Ktedonobacterales bacterium]|jgi:hypothetical protein
MSKALELSDEQYALMKQIGDETGRTPEEMLLAWALDEETRHRLAHPTYYQTDDWLRHLGVSDEEIEASRQRVRAAAELPHDADA